MMKSCFYLFIILPAALGISYTPGTGTCEGRCNDHYDLYNECQCTEDCEKFGDCCVDYFVHCVEPPIPEDSCEGQCGLFQSGKPCQCNDGCVSFGDCCDDYAELCGGVDPGTTCVGRCDRGYEPGLACQCNDQCETFGNCCNDYVEECVGVDPGSTCVGRCDSGYDPELTCQCNDQCVSFGNCCNDYAQECLGTPATNAPATSTPTPVNSCKDNCDADYDPSLDCQCNTRCPEFDNCCPDYITECAGTPTTSTPTPVNSCRNNCDADYDPSLVCQCNTRCPEFDNCCPDYITECAATCDGRCDDPFDGDQPCQCNDNCVTYGDCCPDYNDICLNGTGPQPITNADIAALAELIWSLDVNRLSNDDYTIDKQENVDDNNGIDYSPNPFFTNLNESALSSRTYQAFIAMFDNYISETSNEEIYTLEELAEIEEFLDAVFETEVMNATTQFFIEKGWYDDELGYREWTKHVWFGNYSRRESDPFFDSSGFEHVFMGETRSSGVTGFHNWLKFYYEEKTTGDLNYYGYVREKVPDQIGLQFRWKNVMKELGSVIIGASPEFEFAMFSLCFRVRGGSQCTFTLDGYETKIQTYSIRDPGYIGSAYFIV